MMPQLVMTAVTRLPQVQIDSDPKTWAAEAEKLAAGKGDAAGTGSSKVRCLASTQRLHEPQVLAHSTQSSSDMLNRPDRVTHGRPANAQQASRSATQPQLHDSCWALHLLKGPPGTALHAPRHACGRAPMHPRGREPGAAPAPDPVELPVVSLMSVHCVRGTKHRTAQQQAASRRILKRVPTSTRSGLLYNCTTCPCPCAGGRQAWAQPCGIHH